MIEFELLRDKGILLVRPSGPLSADDFRKIAVTVDPYIAEKGKLNGVLVEAPSFPGLDSFVGLIEHFRFVRDHHRDIERVAAVTDDDFLKIAPGSQRISLILKSGSSQALTRRMRWLGSKNRSHLVSTGNFIA
jgi:hypothetical protein